MSNPNREELATFLASLTADDLSALNPSLLATAIATAEQRDRDAVAAVAAAGTVERTASAAITDAVALITGAAAAGLTIDLATVLAAAVERATPAAPEVLAGVIAPDPAPVSVAGATRRTRRRVERTWSGVESGSIWQCSLAGATGRVKITVDPDGAGASFTATTGNRGTFRSPSRAVQSACGNPAGAGRKGEATVNGFLALTRDSDGNGAVTLDSVTAV